MSHPSTPQTLTVRNLETGKKYYVTIRPKSGAPLPSSSSQDAPASPSSSSSHSDVQCASLKRNFSSVLQLPTEDIVVEIGQRNGPRQELADDAFVPLNAGTVYLSNRRQRRERSVGSVSDANHNTPRPQQEREESHSPHRDHELPDSSSASASAVAAAAASLPRHHQEVPLSDNKPVPRAASVGLPPRPTSSFSGGVVSTPQRQQLLDMAKQIFPHPSQSRLSYHPPSEGGAGRLDGADSHHQHHHHNRGVLAASPSGGNRRFVPPSEPSNRNASSPAAAGGQHQQHHYEPEQGYDRLRASLERRRTQSEERSQPSSVSSSHEDDEQDGKHLAHHLHRQLPPPRGYAADLTAAADDEHQMYHGAAAAGPLPNKVSHQQSSASSSAAVAAVPAWAAKLEEQNLQLQQEVQSLKDELARRSSPLVLHHPSQPPPPQQRQSSPPPVDQLSSTARPSSTSSHSRDELSSGRDHATDGAYPAAAFHHHHHQHHYYDPTSHQPEEPQAYKSASGTAFQSRSTNPPAAAAGLHHYHHNSHSSKDVVYGSTAGNQSHLPVAPLLPESNSSRPIASYQPDPSLLKERHRLERRLAKAAEVWEERQSAWQQEVEHIQRQVAVRRTELLERIESDCRATERALTAAQQRRQMCEDAVRQLESERRASDAAAESERAQVEAVTAKLDGCRDSFFSMLSQYSSPQSRASTATKQPYSSDRVLSQRIAATAAQKHKYLSLLAERRRSTQQLRAELESVAQQRKDAHNQVEDAKGNIRVIVRMRPEVPSDRSAPYHNKAAEDGSVMLDETHHALMLSTPTAGTRRHEFYAVYGPSEDSLRQQGLVFEEQVAPLLRSVFDGVNVAVLAYGPTGSGKTFTILGQTGDGQLSGLLPQSAEYLLDTIPRVGAEDRRIGSRNGGGAASPGEGGASTLHRLVSCSLTMVELYLDSVFDLLGQVVVGSNDAAQAQKVDIRQGSDSVTLSGLTEVELLDWQQAMELIQRGIAIRRTHKTLKNLASSRSHLLVTLHVALATTTTSSPTTRTNGPMTTTHIQKSKLVFCDLAGSERVSRSLSQDDRLKEAQHINKSLSALGDVVHALSVTPRPQYIPYRNSKLTQLLYDAVGGNAKTLLVTCICPHLPEQHNLSEIQSTLQFACRVKLVRNSIPFATASGSYRPLTKSTLGAVPTRSAFRLPAGNVSHSQAAVSRDEEERPGVANSKTTPPSSPQRLFV